MSCHKKAKTRHSGSGGKIAGLYDLEETIGKGHFAVVKLARHVFTGEKVAVKVIDKTKLDEVSRDHLFQEVRCMKLVQHPNVVRLYEVIDTQTKLYLILELGDGGDMYDYIMKHDRGLDENTARIYFKQIVQAIQYCHRLHVVHRDLKPENVVFFENLGIVKLTDFGFSNKFVPGSKLETSCGTLAYSAPEILLGDSYDAPSVDVWSLGVILYMLVVGKPPFQEANDSETLTMILDCKYDMPRALTPELHDLIQRMLVRAPDQRISLDDICGHAWLTQGGPPNTPLLPLISRELLSKENHSYIQQRMVDGKIASEDEIVQSLERDAYDHITATYYLLAERLLRKQQESTAPVAAITAALASHGDKPSTSASDSRKPQLAPLALSPRVQSADAASSSSRHRSVASPTTPSPTHDRPGSGSGLLRKPSLLQENVLEEEEEEEDMDTSEAPTPRTAATRHGRPQLRSCRSVDDSGIGTASSHAGVLREESDSDGHSRSSSADRSNTSSPSHAPAPPPPGTRRVAAPTTRPLKTVRSSPNMLNEIFEEVTDTGSGNVSTSDVVPVTVIKKRPRTIATTTCRKKSKPKSGESEEDDDFLSSPPAPRGSVLQRGKNTPDLHRRGYRSGHGSIGSAGPARKRITGSGVRAGPRSASSSDASDNDEPAEHRIAGKEFCSPPTRIYRRDSSDHSSDTDTPGLAGGSRGAGFSNTAATTSSSRGNNRRHSNDENKPHKSKHGGGGSGGGKQNGSVLQTQNPEWSQPAGDSGGGSSCENMQLKISNMSLGGGGNSATSNLCTFSSCSSLSSSSRSAAKYRVAAAAPSATPRTARREAQHRHNQSMESALNEENRARSSPGGGQQVIHVRSKDFSALMERFAAPHSNQATDSSSNPPQAPAASNVKNNVKFRKRPKHGTGACTHNNRIKVDINRNGLIPVGGTRGADRLSGNEEDAMVTTPAQIHPNNTSKCCSVV